MLRTRKVLALRTRRRRGDSPVPVGPVGGFTLALMVVGLALGGLGGSELHAQAATGRIVGQVVDGETGKPLPGALVRVAGTAIETLAGVDGRFILGPLPTGPTTLRVSNFGYATKEVTGIEVPGGGSARMDVTLEPAAVAVADLAVRVTAEGERGSVARALNAQRTALAVTNTIGSEQIGRSPDGHAAEAIQRVSGVTIQDGKYVFVRGLGERYTTTSLNGARIPSPEPEKKVVPLDLFPAGLLDRITTSKSFTPDQPGDFSGAQVDLRTRDFPLEREVVISTSAGFNTRATGRTLLRSPGTGLEWLALGALRRDLPAALESRDLVTRPLSTSEVNQTVSSFRNAWTARQGRGDPKSSFSLSAGGTTELFGRDLGYLLSTTYSRSQEIRDDQVRANALATDGGGTREIDRYEGSTGSTSVRWGGILNLNALLGRSTRIALDNSYIRTAEDEARFETGFSENLGNEFQIHRLRYVERSVRSTQLRAEHQLGARHRVDWSLTASGVTREEPDRSEIVYIVDTDPLTGEALAPAWFSVANEAAVRTYAKLTETAWQANADYRLSLGDGPQQHQLRVGAAARRAERDADNRSFSITASLDRASRELAPEQIFDGRFTEGDGQVFRLTPLGAGGSYEATDRLFAGYGMVELALTDRLRLVTGARIERSEVEVRTEPTIGSPVTTNPSFTDVLPSLTLNYKLSERQNLRLSGSQTLARPEYRELAPVQFREVIHGDNILGSPDLRRGLIRNADLRWEWFPSSGEVLSVGLFAKRFRDPIERIFLATSGTRVISFVNAEGAENFGLEVEARKRLGFLAEGLDRFTAFTNLTVMDSDIRIGSGAASRTRDERPMVGQAPYVANVGLGYATPEGRTSATFLYNVVGRRIVSASEAPLPDIYQEARRRLDLSLRVPLFGSVSGKFDAENLLDDPAEVTQGTVTREFYRTGRSFSTGFSWSM